MRATETTDVEVALVALRKRCERAKLPARDIKDIEERCRDALAGLVRQGRELSAMGSQMHVRREIAGQGCLVEIRFQTGGKKSMLQRFTDAFLRVK